MYQLKKLSDRHTFSKSHKRNIEPIKITVKIISLECY